MLQEASITAGHAQDAPDAEPSDCSFPWGTSRSMSSTCIQMQCGSSKPSISQDVCLCKPPECTSASSLRFREGRIPANKPPSLSPRCLLREGLFLSSGSENRHLCRLHTLWNGSQMGRSKPRTSAGSAGSQYSCA